jgi:hypothetical protein
MCSWPKKEPESRSLLARNVRTGFISRQNRRDCFYARYSATLCSNLNGVHTPSLVFHMRSGSVFSDGIDLWSRCRLLREAARLLTRSGLRSDNIATQKAFLALYGLIHIRSRTFFHSSVHSVQHARGDFSSASRSRICRVAIASSMRSTPRSPSVRRSLCINSKKRLNLLMRR